MRYEINRKYSVILLVINKYVKAKRYVMKNKIINNE